MIKLITEHRISLLLLLVLLLVQSFFIDLNNPYQKPIGGDAKGYYAYLPAIFIYHDLDYSFVPEIEKKHYVPGLEKSFVKTIDGEKVNKTFPGLAVLYLPFFLLAHLISLLLGLPADGYAYTYQLFHLVGFWTYFFLGLVFFKKVLRQLNFASTAIDWSILALVLGTNILFYTVFDASVTHIYNFFMVNLAVFLFIQFKHNFSTTRLVSFFGLLTLIGITRPTNILILAVLPIFVTNKAHYIGLFKEIIRLKNVFIISVLSLLILSIPLILWKLQAGNWIVYSYGEEGFDFTHPEIFNFLFSYTKGWFVYTPLAIIILLFGFPILFKTEKTRALFIIAFFLVAIYIFSSWWCWYYGAGMSQRVMIDYYLVLGFLFLVVIDKLKIKFLRLSFFALTSLAALVNIAQTYQVGKGILPFGSPTKQQYWDNFLVFEKRARVYPQENWKFIEEQTNPNWQISVSKTLDYSPIIKINTSEITKGSKLVFSFDAIATTPIEETRLVVNLKSGESGVYFLKAYSKLNEWVKMEFLLEPKIQTNEPLEIFLWNVGSTETVDIKNFQFRHYFSDEYF